MAPGSKTALWQLAFRPFFFFGSLYALVAVALWLSFLFGVLPYRGHLALVTWHSHEMVFGFASAVMAGFVLTASQNWTGLRGVHGLKLQLIFGLWALGRVLMATSPAPSAITTLVDLGFYPLLAIYMFPYLKDPEMKVERVFFAYFAIFFAGNLLVHLDAHGILPGHSRKGILLGLYTMVIVVIFMGGRVIPFFTESTLAKAQPKTWEPVERLSHISAWLFLASQIFYENSLWSALIAFGAALIHLIRLWGWQVRRVRRIPIIWVLHTAYFWLATGFAMAGLASLGLIASSASLHAFTVGGLSIVIYGMITRVSLGHTGRPLRPTVPIVTAYYLLIAAAVVRVFAPLISPSLHDGAVIFSGALWIAAFFIFLVIYGPILTSPRIDGRPG